MTTRNKKVAKIPASGLQASGGGLEGADKLSREMFSWQPRIVSPNEQIARDKDLVDLRSTDIIQNEGMASGAIATFKDSIVGAKFLLNAKPNWKVIGAPEGWAEEFQEVAESRFNLLADSPENWLDASRLCTLTGMVRLAIASYFFKGEVTASSEWLKAPNRPCGTAIKMFDPIRMSNPNGMYDTQFLRKGVAIDKFGAPQGYHIRHGHPGDLLLNVEQYRWSYVPARKPWGRPLILHIFEPMQAEQNRGISQMVAVLKSMRMTKKFSEIALQNAVINASYAAVLESELPPEVIYNQLGGNAAGISFLQQYMAEYATYMGAAKNIHIDGAKIPTLFPGTKLNLKNVGTPGGIGTDFEASLHRYTAAGLGLSYEEYTRDYTKTNYSSARAGAAQTERGMVTRKKMIADRFATMVYSLWLEEDLMCGNLPLPSGFSPADFYKPLMKEAFCSADWIGAGAGMIDPKKETEAAIMRIKSGLSTYEREIARMGDDFREVFAQRAREEKLMTSLGLYFNMDSQNAENAKGSTSADDEQDDKRPE